MFNLLPHTERDALRKEYMVRLGITALFLLCSTFVIASILLVPSLFLSVQKEAVVVRRSEALLARPERAEAAEFRKELRQANARLSLLSERNDRLPLYELLAKIASVRTERISLENLSFVETKEGRRQADLSGTAKDRTALLAFVKALEETKLFEKVDVPISNFARDTDIDFFLRLTGVTSPTL